MTPFPLFNLSSVIFLMAIVLHSSLLSVENLSHVLAETETNRNKTRYHDRPLSSKDSQIIGGDSGFKHETFSRATLSYIDM